MKSSPTVRQFLHRKYFAALSLVLVFMVLASAAIVHMSVQRVSVLTAARIEDAIEMNRYELLDEIALGDAEALKQHLSILRLRLDLDRIELSSQIGDFSAHRPNSHVNWWIRRLAPLFPVSPLSLSIANDFGSFQAAVDIRYAESVLLQAAVPLVEQAAITTAGVLILLTAIFLALFRQIDRGLLVPLRDLRNRFRLESGRSQPFTSTQLCEIQDLQESFSHYDTLRKKEAVAELAAQLAHDIRSPLTVLSVLSDDIFKLPEDRRHLVRNAVSRIEEIAESLVRQQQSIFQPHAKHDATESVLILPLLQQVVEEKQLQLGPGVKLRLEAHIDWNLTVRGQRIELTRIISNLVTNAIEAIGPGDGEIIVRTLQAGEYLQIDVSDTGVGIASENLARVFEKGTSLGKPGGSGLGLYHAKKFIEKWGGTIWIRSILGKQTTVSMTLVKLSAPGWLATRVRMSAKGKLVIVDDEMAIHALWSKRLDGSDVPRTCYSSLSRADAELANQENRYLVDYEFAGSEQNGLDWIEKHRLQEKSILVTAHAGHEPVLSRAEALGVPMLPKELILHIPLDVADHSKLAATN